MASASRSSKTAPASAFHSRHGAEYVDQLPLSAEALAIIKSTPASEARDLVFGRGAGGFGGWTVSKATLDKRMPKPAPRLTSMTCRTGQSTICAGALARAPTS